MEAVDQFQIETAGIRATDGRTRVGVFKCGMKSGTNSIDGAVFGFLRNAAFDGNSWFNKSIWEYGGCESRAAFQPLCARPFDNISHWGSASVDRFCGISFSSAGRLGVSLRKG